MELLGARLCALTLATVSTAVAVVVAVVTVVHPTTVNAASPPAPVLFVGAPPGAGRIAGVELFVVPPSRAGERPGDTRALHRLDADHTQTDREYTVHADPAAVPSGLRSSDGVVDFMVFSTDARGQVWSVSFSGRATYLPAGPGRVRSEAHVWLDPGTSSGMVVRGRRSRDGYPALRARELPRVLKAVGDGDPDDETVDVPAGQYVPVPAPRAQAGGDPGTCLRETYVGERNVSTTIGTSYPIGETRSWMTHDSSTRSESTLGIAVGLEGDAGGVTFTRNGTKSTTGSWGGTWEPAPHMRSYRIQVNYHHYVLGKGCNGAVHYWRPHLETGGAFTNRNGLARPGWTKYCAPQPRNYTFYRDRTDGNAYTYDAAVTFASVIGVDLSISRQYSTNQKISYKFSNDRRHRLCGSDEYPSYAGKLIDRYV